MRKRKRRQKGKSIKILIMGDIVVDHHLYRGEREWPSDTSARTTVEVTELGGAAIIYRLLSSQSGDQHNPCEAYLGLKKDLALYPHCYAVWEPSPRERGGDKNTLVWRATNAFGYGDWPRGDQALCTDLLDPEAPRRAEVVVVDDAGMGFRDREACWPAALLRPNNRFSWLVWKMSGALGKGRLWDCLKADPALLKRTILVLSASDLRRAELAITQGLSWERVALDTVHELAAPSIRVLSQCRHVVVSFESAGAVWADFTEGDRPVFTLIYDPQRIEGDPAQDVPGRVFGFQACLTAGIAWELSLQLAKPGKRRILETATVRDGVRRGLKAKQLLLADGHGVVGGDAPRGFPVDRLFRDAFREPPQMFVHARVPAPTPNVDQEKWTILGHGAVVLGGKTPPPLFGDAALVAAHGLSALAGMPSLQLGSFSTVDRQEIEPLRILRRLIADYEAVRQQEKPLSMAVFGAPGAGKSFIVKQLAYSLFDKNTPFLVFNLSQFSDEKELTGAFHRVRDEVLSGRTPVVFWDEFDSQEYRWLQYLLAPMQDGVFQEGQITHPIGKCVFVFAGGTSSTLEDFGPPKYPKSEDWQDFKRKKGPDFISRLHGYLNVLGPNPCQASPSKRGTRRAQASADICFPIRRALILRGNLRLKPSEPLAIDRGLLSALLRAKGYVHGARSFEKIVVALQQGGFPLHRAALPARQVLARELFGMHGVARFYRLMEEYRVALAKAEKALIQARRVIERNLDKFAARIHAAYQQALLPSADMLKAFGKLDEFGKDSNRFAVRRIPEVFAAIGLWMHPGAASRAERGAAASKLERFLELAAAAEHQGWMDFLFQRKWRYADIPEKDPVKLLHPFLIPYDKLREVTKEKDRRQVRLYLDLVHQMNFKLLEI